MGAYTEADLHKIRVVTIDDEPWFVAVDVCYVLGSYIRERHGRVDVNTTMAVRHLHQDEVAQLREVSPNNIGGLHPMTLIVPESGLYKLIMRSDKEKAQPFQDWVTREVLPTIRKDGAYIMGEEKVKTGEMSEDELVLKAMGILSSKVERLTQERDEAQAVVEAQREREPER
ncbi:BRO family protein [Magnetospira sp. QH-2]|uniref:BRO-N domain-containing protein n=1 Tax=Magnetospira sp. (strain QH-2) TaxID=1288970 RepID=UPI0003E80DA1|nr:BRO family protein [Magnetospira sp. QH-2]CCQ73918.1 BRO family, N-terminal domain protein. Phage-related DNA binding protein [Magnetospira sp. QH-2]